MAERKRGLGRGIGSLIPDVINEDRPVDVFFPQSKKNVSRETSKDPAESMRQFKSQKARLRQSLTLRRNHNPNRRKAGMFHVKQS
mgnify:CR=1 FL=1